MSLRWQDDTPEDTIDVVSYDGQKRIKEAEAFTAAYADGARVLQVTRWWKNLQQYRGDQTVWERLTVLQQRAAKRRAERAA